MDKVSVNNFLKNKSYNKNTTKNSYFIHFLSNFIDIG